jgi:L-asparaginase
MKRGASVADAALEAAEDMRALRGGVLGRVTIHAIDTRGNHKVVAVNGVGDNTYWLWPGKEAPQSLHAEPVAVHSNDIKPSATTRYAYGR